MLVIALVSVRPLLVTELMAGAYLTYQSLPDGGGGTLLLLILDLMEALLTMA